MPNFNGQLRSNEIFAALYNMIISQQVFADNIAGTYGSLADRFRVDGTLYGDTKLYYSTDVLSSSEWGNDAEAQDLLKLYRPEAPEVQAIVIDQFRQICLTTDDYLSKRAWSTEGAFSDFTSVMKGWIGETKKIYDATLVNAYVGTAESDVGKQEQTIDLPAVADDPEAQNRLQAQTIAEKIANIFVELKDISRDYNDYGNLRSLSEGDLMVVWNSEFYNKILKIDLPTVYHKDELLKGGEVLPARYFGKVNTAAAAGDGSTVRSLIEQIVGDVHVFAGDLIPNGVSAPAGTSYTADPTIVCKIIHKNSVPYMSAFEVGTSFFNPKALTETQYLTFGHSTLEYLKNYPFVTVRAE